MQRYTVYFICKLIYMFWVVHPPIIRGKKQPCLQHLVLVYCYCYSLFYLETALHVLGGTSTHHQEQKTTVSTASGISLLLLLQVYFIWKLIYMFRVVPPPIIRSKKQLYLQHLVLVRLLLLQFILSGNCSTLFGWYLHPSSGAHTTVSTASGICHTVTVICRYRGRV
jgi:hypothetical protein